MTAHDVSIIAAEPALVRELSSSEDEEDDDDQYADDSAYAGSIAGTETTTLKSSVSRYREEGGRTYHAYGSTEHWGPNDEQAQEQQDLSHHLWLLTLKGDLYVAPIEHPLRVLDLGTGTGIWAIEVGDRCPEATVTGIDLSPIQPTWLPPNVNFLIDDYNADWLDVNKYDLIHARELLGTVPDWVELYRKALTALRPGGWFDHAEPSAFFVSDLCQLDEKHAYPRWNCWITEAGTKAGMSFDVAPYLKGWMEQAGFINVREVKQPWTIGSWSNNKHQRETGRWNQVRLEEGIKDFCGRRFKNQLGMDPEYIDSFCDEMRSAFRQRSLCGYQWAYFVCGQKP